MRIVKEPTGLPFKVTIFSWNNKYLIKAEQDGMEQTFKVAEWDIVSIDDLDSIWNDEFIDNIQRRFSEMKNDMARALDS